MTLRGVSTSHHPSDINLREVLFALIYRKQYTSDQLLIMTRIRSVPTFHSDIFDTAPAFVFSIDLFRHKLNQDETINELLLGVNAAHLPVQLQRSIEY